MFNLSHIRLYHHWLLVACTLSSKAQLNLAHLSYNKYYSETVILCIHPSHPHIPLRYLDDKLVLLTKLPRSCSSIGGFSGSTSELEDFDKQHLWGERTIVVRITQHWNHLVYTKCVKRPGITSHWTHHRPAQVLVTNVVIHNKVPLYT